MRMSFLDLEWLEHAPSKRWLVAVSGGRDSMALLHACAHDKRLKQSNSLVVCHVNHQLRGNASDGDEKLVRRVAEEYGLPCFIQRIDVAGIAKVEKQSLELAAREVRHEVFSRACEEYQCDGVLLAHHADDQVETTLYHLLRGSAGLRGMQKETYFADKDLTLVRPIIHVRRSEIDGYISAHELEYREDASNAEPFAVRNRLRNEVIPLLREVMGRDVAPAVLKSLNHAEGSEAFIQEMFDYSSMLDPQERIHLPSMREVPTVIQRRILHRYLRENKVSNVSNDLIESALTLLDASKPAKINLPRGRFLRRKEQRIFISIED